MTQDDSALGRINSNLAPNSSGELAGHSSRLTTMTAMTPTQPDGKCVGFNTSHIFQASCHLSFNRFHICHDVSLVRNVFVTALAVYIDAQRLPALG